ncbi:MAG: imidazole glycerol phosphate synthase subunit HisF [Phycisphaerae bacterium]|nr:imidazole glycerol phosphate synthase subunit HisF [Phycisphaerae bacterium]
MLTRRIIPCLDVKDGNVVKGVQFQNLRPMGDPLELARRHVLGGADELCFLDVTASIEARPLLIDLIRRLSEVVFVPFTIGGGIQSVADARDILRAGADKIGVNTAAVQRPELLRELAEEFGAQCVVLSIDTCSRGETWFVTTHGGRTLTDRPALDWAQQAVDLGAGEILLNAIDTDGQREGFSIGITDAVCRAVTVPVIASGGAGGAEDFVQVFQKTGCSAALAASIFHDGSWTSNRLKEVLRERGIEVRLG